MYICEILILSFSWTYWLKVIVLYVVTWYELAFKTTIFQGET